MCSLLWRRVTLRSPRPLRGKGKKKTKKNPHLTDVSSVSELFSDKSNTHEFVDLVKELALPGELAQNRSYDFEFMQVEKPYESYVGANVRLRYFIYQYQSKL